MTILVTGSAGFIGNALAKRLLETGERVVGLDNLNPYYDVRLKEARLARIAGHAHFTEARISLEDKDAVASLFEKHHFSRVFHLGAQAGVRYSLSEPWAYVNSNVAGTLSVLEACRAHRVEHLIFASSSSVYGANTKQPFSETDPTDHPISLYAATKKAAETIAHAYSHLFAIPTTGLRFFTVYGPWGRPDMALFKFSEAILAGRPIQVFDHGRMRRDFTYVDDIVEGVVRIAEHPPGAGTSTDGGFGTSAPYRLYNIGNHQPIELNRLIEILERCLGRKAVREDLPIQPGEVPTTYADTDALALETGFRPSTPIEEGVARFVDWYRGYYGV